MPGVDTGPLSWSFDSSSMRRAVLALVLGLVLVVAVLGIPTSAFGAAAYQHSGSFGGAGTGDGLFRDNPMPQRMAVHQESGKLFVADSGNNRVQAFTPAPGGATFAFSIPTPQPQGVAVDQVSGDLYVVNRPVSPDPGRVTKFNPDSSSNPTAYTEDLTFTSPVQGTGTGQVGAFAAGSGEQVYQGGIAVDPVTRDILIADVSFSGNQVRRYTSAGAYVSSFDGSSTSPERPAFNKLMDIATGPNGDVITTDFTFQSGGTPGWVPRIDRYNAAGELQATPSSRGHNEITMSLSQSFMTVGVDQESGEVFAVSQIGDGFFVPRAPGQIYQFENDELVRAFGVSGTGLDGYKAGIAVRSDPARLYVLSTDNAGLYQPPGPPQVQVFDAAVPPSIDEPIGVGGVTARQATVSGTINPNGQETTWRVQYRKAGTSGWPNETAPELVGSGTADLDVEMDVEDLAPFTDYEARIAAATSGGAEVYSNPVSFKTLRDEPEIGMVISGFLNATSAEIRAEINPLSAPTRYWVEYGTTDSYGSRAPAEPASSDAGSAAVAEFKVQKIEGLEPATTYHYKLVAENDTGMRSESADHTFTTLAQAQDLGPERGYEVVSQLPTGGALINGVSEVSPDGKRALYYHEYQQQLLPEAKEKPFNFWLAERGEDGWKSTGTQLMEARPEEYEVETGHPLGTPDLSRIVGYTRIGIDPDDRNRPPHVLFTDPFGFGMDVYLYRPGDTPTWVTRDPRIEKGIEQTDSGVATMGASGSEGWMTADGGVMSFKTERRLLDEDTTSAGAASVYKWRENGALTLVGVRPDGSVPTGGVGVGMSPLAENPGGGNVATGPALGAMSADGASLVWSARRHDAASGSWSLYLQRDGQPSVEISREQGVPALPSPHPMVVRYHRRSEDGRFVFFTSASRLTPDSGASNSTSGTSDLYMYDVQTGDLKNLTPRLDAGPGMPSEPAVDDQARVRKVLAVAPDGSRAYFVADAILDAQPSPLGALPSSTGSNLYLAEIGADGGVSYKLVTNRVVGNQWAISEHGTTFAFASNQTVTGQATGGYIQAFVYDSEANSLYCASCAPGGPVPVDSANGSIPNDANVQWAGSDKRWLASDGTFFVSTRSRLTSGDQNSTIDVYEFRAGQWRLLSGGFSERHAYFEGASLDGQTAFIRTPDALAPEDKEPGVRKIYAAVVGGGFAPAAGPDPCLGDACQGVRSAPPPANGPASNTIRGLGNLVESPRSAESCRAARKQANKAGRAARSAKRLARRSAGQRLKRSRKVRARKFSTRAKRLNRKAQACMRANRRASR